MNFRIALLAALLCLINIGTGQQKTPHRHTSQPAESAAAIYRNPIFGFRYRIPYGWVDRTKEMQDGNDAGKGKGEVLLAVFERPPQAVGDTINSAVVIAAENAAAYPGLKKAEDYLGPLTELATAKKFKAQRTVRADFSKALNDKLIMHQSTLVLLGKGRVVTFTFIAESVDAVDDLIDGISFSALKSKAK